MKSPKENVHKENRRDLRNIYEWIKGDLVTETKKGH